jgi:hypothetical protein
MSYGHAVKNKTPRQSFHPYHVPDHVVDKNSFAIAIKRYGPSQAMLHKILNHPYEISIEYFKISGIDPRNHKDTKYRELLLHTLRKIPSIVTLRELYRINVFFTRLQEDSLARRFTDLNTEELQECIEILKSIYGESIPDVFYDKKMNQSGAEIERTLVLSDMGIVNATQLKMRGIEKTPCRYNTRCTNKEEEHRALFTHPHGGTRRARKTRKTRRARNARTKK